jgi:L-alanine-DL-glutamate epimerase-like enolase superfamily enzyme
LGYTKSFAKEPYASVLFGDTDEGTLEKAERIAQAGFRAAKFGSGPFGASTPEADRDQLQAAAAKGLAPMDTCLSMRALSGTQISPPLDCD